MLMLAAESASISAFEDAPASRGGMDENAVLGRSLDGRLG